VRIRKWEWEEAIDGYKSSQEEDVRVGYVAIL